MSVIERFWAKVDKHGPNGCWQWTSTFNNKGYGRFWTSERVLMAHRFAYENIVGLIPDGLEIDHLCRNPACVRPNHLEPVTRRENQLRGVSISGLNARKTHCPQGHPYDDANTYIQKANRRRKCRICHRAYRKRVRERQLMEVE
ncbi:hypothetical protein LCGC14_2556770 [marine sediment metagenome]|uniref:HNH nuclease domain-containing protein n=1 Tax=marine sediment metagenome TaxID=412755 RepID=A0A0F9AL83_9ZZZZ